MSVLNGGCHCRNITVEFETDSAPADMTPRACQCSFCRQHQSRAVSDPSGRLRIHVADGRALSRYQFSLKTIEFLVCRTCGVYVGAIMPDPTDDKAIATLMISTLDDRAAFPPPVAKDYDDQDAAARADRRRELWTPTVLTVAT